MKRKSARSPRETEDTGDSLGWGEAITEFGGTLLLERGRAEKTVSAYESDLRQAAAFFRRERGVERWAAVTGEDAAAWGAGLDGARRGDVESSTKVVGPAHVGPTFGERGGTGG